MAALMCLHPPLRFRFAILISGFVPRDPHYANLFESPPPSGADLAWRSRLQRLRLFLRRGASGDDTHLSMIQMSPRKSGSEQIKGVSGPQPSASAADSDKSNAQLRVQFDAGSV